jgi:hypothetical protein
MIRYLRLLNAGVLALIICTAGSEDAVASNTPLARNVVARYLEGAELQAETNEQRREIAQALQDMLSMPAAELRKQRYSDYSGTQACGQQQELLRAHFCPLTTHGA